MSIADGEVAAGHAYMPVEQSFMDEPYIFNVGFEADFVDRR